MTQHANSDEGISETMNATSKVRSPAKDTSAKARDCLRLQRLPPWREVETCDLCPSIARSRPVTSKVAEYQLDSAQTPASLNLPRPPQDVACFSAASFNAFWAAV